MNWHEIVKYCPTNYDKNGIYTIDEWTSISDVGKCYNGKIFTLDDYLEVEHQYIDVIHSIMRAANCKYMTIQYLEADKKYIIERIKSSKFQDIDTKLLLSIPFLKEKKKIYYKNIDDIIRLSLREYIYVILSNKKQKLKIEFGYDYYLYISCSLDNAFLYNIVNNVGLFLNPRG